MGRDDGVETPSRLRDARQVYHFWLDDSVYDVYGPLIGPYGLAVYGYLARRAKQGESFPSHKRIAHDTGMSRMSVIRTLKILQDHGLIAIHSRKSQHGDLTSNVYVLNDLSHLSQRGSIPERPGSIPEVQGSTIEIQGVVPQGYDGSTPGVHEVVPTLSSTQEEVVHTPSPAQSAVPPRRGGTRVRPAKRAYFQTFPQDLEGQSDLRTTILTENLSTWVREQGLVLDVRAEFERWLNDGLAHQRRYCDLPAAFRVWLTSPYQQDNGRAREGKDDRGQRRMAAAGQRVLEELQREQS